MTLPRVLIVDDDVALRRAYARVLLRAGLEPAEAGSVREAIAELVAGGADVMLLDLDLPRTSGHALLKELDRRRAALPVIVVSGSPRMEDAIQALRHHAFDYLRKPLEAPLLLDAVQRALASPEHHGVRPPRGPAAGAPTPPPSPRAAGLALRQAGIDEAPTPPPAPRAARDGSPGGPAPPAPPGATPPPPPAARPGAEGRRPARSLREVLDRLLGAVEGGEVHLPALDPRMDELRRLVAEPDAGTDAVATAIARDPALTAAVLRAANSSFYLPRERITDLRQACVRLGNRHVFAIAQEVLVAGSLRARHEPYRGLMRRAAHASVVAARLAVRLGQHLGDADPLVLHVLALLHNVGELLVLQLLSELPAGSPAHDASLRELAAGIGQAHERFGGALARAWRLPPAVARLAGSHHQPAYLPEPRAERRERLLVLAAWALALRAGHGYLPGHAAVDPGPALEALGVPLEEVEPLVEEAAGWTP